MAEEEDAQMAAKAKKTPSKSPSTPKVQSLKMQNALL